MKKRGWIKEAKSYDELESNVLAYFELQSVNDLFRFPHAARRNYGEDLSAVQIAWLLRVRQMATALRIGRYSEERLRSAIPHLERLMTEPEEIRHVPRILVYALLSLSRFPARKFKACAFGFMMASAQ
jgi:HTH-type transcriptional regulator / antitoxin HigA